MSVVWSGVTREGKEVGVGCLVGCHEGRQGCRCWLSGRVSRGRARRSVVMREVKVCVGCVVGCHEGEQGCWCRLCCPVSHV